MNPGDRLGRYELVREIGRGGMAAVWDADLLGPRGFRRRVALKVVHAHIQVEDADALVQEARLGALISHPNVVSTLELGEADGRWFLCMERVNGASSRALVAERPLSGAALVDLGVQVASGLRHLHALEVDGRSRPLIHRDIKPTNLLVDRAGVAKIADLGISGFREQIGQPAGTLGYAPAEQIAGEPCPASDVFALAVSLFGLATKRRLLGHGTQAVAQASAIEARIARADFRAALDGAVPGLADVLHGCLRLDPSDRPPADVLIEQLLRLRLRATGASLADHVRDPTGPVTLTPSTGSEIPSNLPRLDVEIVGRQLEMVRLRQALNTAGLVALTGSAGAGKTLLAASVAAELPADEAWWVVGTTWASADDAVRGIASTLGFVAPTDAGVAWLGEAIRNRGRMVLVVDDIGHVPGIGPLLTALVDGPLAAARILATSRRRLKSARGVSLGPLGPAAASTLYRSLAHDDPAPEVVAELVERLDGLPLAIELAAARTRYLSSARVLAALDDRFRVLRDGDRALIGALESSWSQLPELARETLIQLAPFEGPFELEDAEAVVRLPGDRWVLDTLGELVDHHLLENSGSTFWMARSVRAFVEREGDGGGGRLRHAAWLAQLGSPEALAALDRVGGAERFEVLRRKRDALERQFDWALQNAPALAAPLGLALLAIADRTGPMAWGMSVVERALSAEHTPTTLVALLERGAFFSTMLGRTEQARSLCETGIQAADHADLLVAGELHRRMALMHPRGSAEAIAGLAAAEAIARATGDLPLLARVTNNRGLATPARSLELLDEALGYARAAGSAELVAVIEGNLALCREKAGLLREAATSFREALRLHRACGDHRGRALTLSSFASFLTEVGDLPGASRAAERAEALHRQLGLTGRLPSVIQLRAIVASLQGHDEDADRLCETARTLVAPGSLQDAELAANHSQVLYLLGRPDEAWERIRPLLELPRREVERTILGLLSIKILLAVGRVELAEAELEANAPHVAQQARPMFNAWEKLGRARLDIARGGSGRAEFAEARRIAAVITPFAEVSELGRELAEVAELVGEP